MGIIVLSSALNGCELWTNLTTNNIRSLRKMQHYSLKRIQDLRKLTQSDMVDSLVGLFDFTFKIDRKKLMFFQKLASLNVSFSVNRVFLNRIYMFTFI